MQEGMHYAYPLALLNNLFLNTSKNTMKIIDLSHELSNSSPVYPGAKEKPPHFEQIATIKTDGYSLWNVNTSLHTGTHIDAPAHMLENGNTLDKIPLTQLCCRAYLIDARKSKKIDAHLIEPVQCAPGCALLFYTGYDIHYNKTDYFTQHPILSESAAKIIIQKKIGIIGIDTPSPDRFPFNLHKLLCAQNILIIENLTQLGKLIGYNHIMLYALPLKCKTDGAPARVIAILEDE